MSFVWILIGLLSIAVQFARCEINDKLYYEVVPERHLLKDKASLGPLFSKLPFNTAIKDGQAIPISREESIQQKSHTGSVLTFGNGRIGLQRIEWMKDDNKYEKYSMRSEFGYSQYFLEIQEPVKVAVHRKEGLEYDIYFINGNKKLRKCNMHILDKDFKYCNTLPTEIEGGEIVDLQTFQFTTVLATTTKAYKVNLPNFHSQPILETTSDEPFQAISFLPKSQIIVIGTSMRYFYSMNNGKHFKFHRVNSLIDDKIKGIRCHESYQKHCVILNSQNLNTGVVIMNRLGGKDGLPFNESISIETTQKYIWIGTNKGMVRMNVNDEEQFKYYYGPRYLPNSLRENTEQAVINVWKLFLNDDSLVVATKNGMSVFNLVPYTLKNKEKILSPITEARHNRFGLTSDCALKNYGDLSSFEMHDSDNDGLWTSMTVASLAFKYAVTKDPNVKKQAWKHVNGLKLLNDITNIPGLPARSALHQTSDPGYGHWHNSTNPTYNGWIWKGDTSSDEIVGHLFAYPLVHDLLAETTEEKYLAKSLILNITKYIIQNNYFLMDVTGKRTTWGVWNPKYLNDDPEWDDERGINSLQILSWLVSAKRIAEGTPDQELIKKALQDLLNHDYLTNIINCKILHPQDLNYSDDELNYLPYFTWMWADMKSNNHTLKDNLEFHASITRTFTHIKDYKSPLWSVMTGIYHQHIRPTNFQEQDLIDGIESLRQWPLEQIKWNVLNEHRLDVTPSRYPSRHDQFRIRELLPYNEIACFRFNCDPYQVNGGSGFVEYEPTAFMLPYWLARYIKFID